MTRRPPSCSLAFVGVAFLLAIAPFDEGAGRDLLPLTALALAGIVLLAGLARRWALGMATPARSPILLPLLAFVALGVASVAWSIDGFVSATGVVRLLACTAVVLVVLNRLNTVADARGLCALFVIIACVLSLLGAWQAATGAGLFPAAGGGARAHAVLMTPNTFAGFLLVAIPLAIGLAVTAASRRSRLAACAAAALLALTLVLTRSTGAWLAAAVGLAALTWLLAAKGRGRRRVTVAAGAAAAVVSAAVLILWASPALRARLLAPLPSRKAATANERFLYLDSAAEMAVAAAPLGLGLDTYHIDYRAHQHASLAGSQQWFAHNDFAQVLVELGPAGFVLLFWLLWRFVRTTDLALARTGDRREHRLIAACFVGASAALLHSVVDYDLYVPATSLAIFLCIALIAAAHARQNALLPRSELLRRPASGRRLAAAGIVAVACLAAATAVRPLIAQRLLGPARPEAAHLAVRICPWAANFWWRLGVAQSAIEPDKAADSFRRAIRLSPRTASYYGYLGRLLHKKGARVAGSDAPLSAGRFLRTAVALDPHAHVFRKWLGEWYLDRHDAERAKPKLAFADDHCRRHHALAERPAQPFKPRGHQHVHDDGHPCRHCSHGHHNHSH